MRVIVNGSGVLEFSGNIAIYRTARAGTACQQKKRGSEGEILHPPLFNHGREMNIDGCRPETHIAVASLVAQFPGHRVLAWTTHIQADNKLRFDRDRTSEYRQFLAVHIQVFGLWIRNGFYLQRSAIPSQFQRNEKLIAWLVAVDMKARQNHCFENKFGGFGALDP